MKLNLKRILIVTLLVVMLLSSLASAGFVNYFARDTEYTETKYGGYPVETYARRLFSDIDGKFASQGGWFRFHLDTLTHIRAVNGYADGTFKPNNTITVAEFSKIVTNTLYYEADREKLKAKGGKWWYSPYIDELKRLGIIDDKMFSESDYTKPITREQMATMMIRAIENIDKEEPFTDESKLNIIRNMFSDYDKIAPNYTYYIEQAVAKGIVNGYADGTFKPQNTATRAEASVMLARMYVWQSRLQPVYLSDAENEQWVERGSELWEKLHIDDFLALKDYDYHKKTKIKFIKEAGFYQITFSNNGRDGFQSFALHSKGIGTYFALGTDGKWYKEFAPRWTGEIGQTGFEGLRTQNCEYLANYNSDEITGQYYLTVFENPVRYPVRARTPEELENSLKY